MTSQSNSFFSLMPKATIEPRSSVIMSIIGVRKQQFDLPQPGIIRYQNDAPWLLLNCISTTL